ncbi:FtsW/RodA/SpoVE family cell cycle protein [Guggenheimella bovis]
MFRKINWGILLPVILLLGIGWILVLSSSTYYANDRYGDMYLFVKNQTINIAIGLVGLFLLFAINYRFWDKLWVVGGLNLIGLVLMIMSLFNTGRKGSTRWVKIGGFDFMPIDIAKMAVIFFLAYLLSRIVPKKNKFAALIVFVSMPMIFILLTILQQNFSSTIILFLITAGILFIGYNSTAILMGIGVTGIVGLASMILANMNRSTRITSFIASLSNVNAMNEQIRYTVFAIASGGLFGVGLGRSTFNKLYIPEPHNDMILSTLGEETGFLGMIIVLALYFVLITNIMRVSFRSKNLFGRYLTFGIGMMLFSQMFINYGTCLNMIPPTGVPLPFISYGGTNLIVALASVGLCLSVDRMENME